MTGEAGERGISPGDDVGRAITDVGVGAMGDRDGLLVVADELDRSGGGRGMAAGKHGLADADNRAGAAVAATEKPAGQSVKISPPRGPR